MPEETAILDLQVLVQPLSLNSVCSSTFERVRATFSNCTGMWKDEKRLNQDFTQLPIQWDNISIKPFMIRLIVYCHNSPCQEENSCSRKKSGRSNANFWTQLHFARECGGIFSGISFSIKLSGTLAPLRRRGCFCSTFHILRPRHRKTSASGNGDLSLRGILPIPHLQTNIQVDRILCDRRASVLQLLNKGSHRVRKVQFLDALASLKTMFKIK